VRTLTLTPAYGRDYKSKKAVIEAWNAGKDFEIANPGFPSYINREDADNDPAMYTVSIRYKGLTRSIIARKADGGWK
jgi:hypothetical protein